MRRSLSTTVCSAAFVTGLGFTRAIWGRGTVHPRHWHSQLHSIVVAFLNAKEGIDITGQLREPISLLWSLFEGKKNCYYRLPKCLLAYSTQYSRRRNRSPALFGQAWKTVSLQTWDYTLIRMCPVRKVSMYVSWGSRVKREVTGQASFVISLAMARAVLWQKRIRIAFAGRLFGLVTLIGAECLSVIKPGKTIKKGCTLKK